MMEIKYIGAIILPLILLACGRNDRSEPTPRVKEFIGQQSSPYITRVIEYRPAPGQYVGIYPTYNTGDTEAVMNEKVLRAIDNRPDPKTGEPDDSVVTLGGFGGYIVFAFDHPVKNLSGKDLQILGNSNWDNMLPTSSPLGKASSGEPGIVMVAYDRNHNGKADEDEWYELAGSLYNAPTTIRQYRISYYRPQPNHQSTPSTDRAYIIDKNYIRWTDNLGSMGYLVRIMPHQEHSYYPQWISDEVLNFEGTKIESLASNQTQHNTSEYWVTYPASHWGYVDLYPNEEEGTKFDIDWAVDKEGRAVLLPEIHYIKVYTAVRAELGWLGEVSTEISGAIDLHILRK